MNVESEKIVNTKERTTVINPRQIIERNIKLSVQLNFVFI